MSEPTRNEVETWSGTVVLEFGASWCPICRAARPLIDQALAKHANAKHVWIEDGKGKPLGRSYRVKLWPTLIFLRDGQEVARLVRPSQPQELEDALMTLE